MITLKKFEEYVELIRKEISQFENQISKAKLEEKPKNNFLLLEKREVEVFSKEIANNLKNLNFETKKAIVRSITNKITSSRKLL